MSEIIRLQGLPPVADSFDIRQFFYGLTIPRGGVYITGGKYGEAFIIFSNFADARYAMTLSGRPLKGSIIYLSFSTEPEMRRALEVYRIGVTDPLSGLQRADSRLPARPGENPSFLYILGMPQKATKVELRELFNGFRVEDVIFLKFINGLRNGNAIIKFRKPTEAAEAMKLDGVFLCGAPVTLRLSNEEEWNENGGDTRVYRRDPSPPRRRFSRRSRSRSRRRTRSRSRRSRSRSRSPRRRERHRSPYIREFYVHMINVSYRAEKKDLKHFFFDLDMDDSHITFLLDKEGRRTREAFAMFTTQKDYKRALKLNLDTFKGHTVNILPISKRDMLDLIDRMKKKVAKDPSKSTSEQKNCIYLRNFASEVSKSDIVKFFDDITVKEDDITLLTDDKGVGLGEALVKFSDEKEAQKAEKLNHKKYESTEILLSRISNDQMKNIMKGASADSDKDALVSQADEHPDAPGESAAMAQEKESVSSSDQAQPSENAKEADSTEETAKKEENPAAEETCDTEETANAEDMDVTPPLEMDPTEFPSDFTDPSQQNHSVDEGSEEPKAKEEAETNDPEESAEGLTLVYIRNLPVTITASEILDFFHGHKVKSVNLKDLANGVATVRMPDNTEAASAIEALNKKEIGSKQVLLSLE